jgi:hypothetical protein
MKDSNMFTIHKTKIENQGKLVPFGSGYVGEKQFQKIKENAQ